MSGQREQEREDGEERRRDGASEPWWNDFVRAENARLGHLLAAARLRQDEVEEILQEVWLKVARHRSRFRGKEAIEHLRRWMSRVVRNKRADWFRRLRRHPPHESLDGLGAEPMACVEDEAAGHERKERKRELFHRWLAELRGADARNYRLMYGHYVDGHAITRLAAEMKMSVRAAYCRLHRQVEKFRLWALGHQDQEAATP